MRAMLSDKDTAPLKDWRYAAPQLCWASSESWVTAWAALQMTFSKVKRGIRERGASHKRYWHFMVYHRILDAGNSGNARFCYP
jgi:hypothetical protein